jgi:hypothetical protein
MDMQATKAAGRLIMHELNETGDTPFEFNVTDEYDVDRAKQLFDKKLSEGFTAYYVDPFGIEEGEMSEFDPQAGKIIFTPPVKAGYPSPPED